MCTVSFINNKEEIIITANRDENKRRSIALPPKTYLLNQRMVTFPMDPKGGGTWFAFNDLCTVVVLLNGADKKHIPKPSYKKSRGLVVLDLISAEDTLNTWKSINLVDIEQFTIVLFEDHKLYQLQWNGIAKNVKTLDNQKKYIWSSSTLYSKEIINQIQQWFNDFLKNKKELKPETILDFHSKTNSEDKINGLIINRDNLLITVNITQLVVQQKLATLKHFDLINKVDFIHTSSLV